MRSASIGAWIGSGSRLEKGAERGIAHFMEHMLFKGTTTRTAEDIARVVDSVGGYLDAYTTKELVSYNTKVLDEHLPLAWDVVSDLILNPVFKQEDIEKEKQVILEELKMELDNPEYVVHELFCKLVWKGHGLGRPIIGTKQTIEAFSREDLLAYHRRIYVPANIVVTAAGNLEHERIVAMVEERFGSLAPGKALAQPAAAVMEAPIELKKKRLQQAHLYIGAPSEAVSHPDRFGIYVLNTILGGGMSSRLFQNIRERQGLVYAVMSDLMSYRDCGLMAIYAGCSAESLPRVIASVMEEFRSLKEKLVDDEELRRAKEHMKGSLVLSLESTSSRMSNLARQQMNFGRFYSIEELLDGIEAVSAEKVRELAQRSFVTEKLSLTALGKVDALGIERASLAC